MIVSCLSPLYDKTCQQISFADSVVGYILESEWLKHLSSCLANAVLVCQHLVHP